jgi:hypothetical protein
LLRFQTRAKAFGITLEGFAPLNYQHALIKLGCGFNLHVQAETVEQLRAQLALLRIARADEHKLRRMLNRDAFTLDQIATRDRHVEQKINQVIFEQVYFVNVEKAAMSACQQPGLKSLNTFLERTLYVKSSANAVFGCIQGKVNYGNGNPVARKFFV